MLYIFSDSLPQRQSLFSPLFFFARANLRFSEKKTVGRQIALKEAEFITLSMAVTSEVVRKHLSIDSS